MNWKDYPYDFELGNIKREIKERDAKIVGLQLPDGLRTVATSIAAEISDTTGVAVIISGNSCYGACDIDEKLEREVDLLFHFGHTCSFPFKPQVVFIELRSSVDLKPVVEMAVAAIKGDSVGLVTTVQHVHAMKEAKSLLTRRGKAVIIGKSPALKYEGQVLGCDFSSAMVPCDEILFLGSGTFHAAGIALYTGKRVIAADPFSMQINILEAEEQRKRRYLAIARALDAKSFGVLVSTKSGQSHLSEAVSLQRKALEKGLTAFVIAMDELTELNLHGFKVDAFVNTACPRLADDFGQFKVLSVKEFEVVLGERGWDDIF